MTARHLNRSGAWLALETSKLAVVPQCERCGAPATEAHRRSDDVPVEERRAHPRYFVSACRTHDAHELELDDVEALCRRCHDASGCTMQPRSSYLERFVGA